MKHKTEYSIPNRNGINASLHHAQTIIEDHTGKHSGDDEICLAIPDIAGYDTDLCQDGTLYLHFSRAEARRFSRILWQMAAQLMTAEQRGRLGPLPETIIDPDLIKIVGRNDKETD